jgi:predicted ArsR family transcriptional regulator
MKITARDVAEHLGCDYVVASGLLTVLVEKGIVKHAENRKHSSGKGKPTRVFEVDRVIQIELAPAPPAVATETTETPAVDSVAEPAAEAA